MYPLQLKKIKESYRLALPDAKKEWPFKIQRTFTFIKVQLFNPRLNISWLKKECLINSKSFATRFRQHINRYPKDFILHHRIEVAKQILKQTEVHVTAAVIAVGFNSPSSFANSFKTRENLTPTQWRKQN